MKFIESLSKGRQILISLRIGLSLAFIGIFLTTAIVIMVFTSYRLFKTFTYIAEDTMVAELSSIKHEITTLLFSAMNTEQLSILMLKDLSVDPKNYQELSNYTFDILTILPDVEMAYWGDEEGESIIARRLPDNTILTEIFDHRGSLMQHLSIYRNNKGQVIKETRQLEHITYDPRERSWYKKAKEAQHTVWTNAYTFFLGEKVGISSVTPVYKQGQLQGVFAIDLKLDSIEKFLTRSKINKISKNGIAFVVDDASNIIVYPSGEELHGSSLNNEFTKIYSLPNGSLARAFEHFQETKKTKFSYMYKNSRYLATFTEVPELWPNHWYIGIVLPSDDLVSKLQRHFEVTVLTALSLVLLGLWVITIFSKRISIPIRKLSDELEEIKYFRIEQKPTLQSRIKEVQIMSKAIESMKMGLSSFRKYVPENLVRQLIYSGEAAIIGGTKREVTLLFSDIKDFSILVEQIGAERIMRYLCGYFDEMTHIIAINNGTIDKYMGDCIMAFWGAPVADEMSAYNACRAALQCEDLLAKLNEQWRKKGGVTFPTRFGIHFGDAIIGNLGSSERLNYTAIGDAVNVTSRLERLNKLYGTKILVSENVKEQVSDKFVFRIIDRVIVKGRAGAGCIYELIQEQRGIVQSEVIEFCEKYQSGFTAYQHQAWDKAINYFEEALSIYLQDVASQVMIKRCQAFKENPPPENWNGIWTYF